MARAAIAGTVTGSASWEKAVAGLGGRRACGPLQHHERIVSLAGGHPSPPREPRFRDVDDPPIVVAEHQ